MIPAKAAGRPGARAPSKDLARDYGAAAVERQVERARRLRERERRAVVAVQAVDARIRRGRAPHRRRAGAAWSLELYDRIVHGYAVLGAFRKALISL